MRRRRNNIQPILIILIVGLVFLFIPWGSAVGGPEDPSGEGGESVPVKVSLKKYSFNAKADTESIEVLFNPKEYTFTKAVPWKHHDIQGLDAPRTEFTHGRPFSLVINLTVDEEDVEEGDVRLPVMAMEQYIIENRDVKRPEPLILTWGKSLDFKCILEKLDVKYTLFNPDGTPLRAEMTTTWKEFSPAEEQLKQAPRH